MTENNSLNLTRKSDLHFSLHSENKRAVRLRDMCQNRFKVNQSTFLNEQIYD